MGDSVGLFVATLICLPALIFALQKSAWIVDYLFLVVALNRGIRRVVDYNNGVFNPFSLISLTPIIVGGLATLVVLIELNRRKQFFGVSGVGTIIPYIAAVTMAFAVGFMNSRFAAVYALGDYIAPIGLLGFGVLYAGDDRIVNRWCHSVAFSALLVGGYGIWQFYTIPPWDAFWLLAVGMDGYMGIPEPMKMTLFSTMAERGPAASYLCGGLTLLLLRRGTLGIFRWPAIGVVLFAMLLTYSRTTVAQAGAALILYPLLNRGSSLVPTILIAVVVVLAGPTILRRLPGSEIAIDRAATLGSIQEDSSLNGRVRLFGIALGEATTEPLGIGIGASGMAERVAKANKSGTMDSTGYIKTLRTFGWLGSVLVLIVMWRIWRAGASVSRLDPQDKNALLFRAWYVSGMIAFLSGDWLFTATFFWVLAGYCLGRADELQELASRDENDFDDELEFA